MALVLRWIVASMVLVWAGTASAQDDVRPEASRLFREGVAASHASRWSEAEDRFERSYDLAHQPLILLNLAAARAELGRLREAIATYERFRAEAPVELRLEHDTAVSAAMIELRARLAHLTIEVTGAPDGAIVMVDGERVESEALADVEVDPGAHRVELRAADRVLVGQAIDIDRGQRLTIPLRPALPGDAIVESAGGEDPWPWVVGASTGVAIAIGVVIGVVFAVMDQGAPLEGYRGNFGPGRYEATLISF